MRQAALPARVFRGGGCGVGVHPGACSAVRGSRGGLGIAGDGSGGVRGNGFCVL